MRDDRVETVPEDGRRTVKSFVLRSSRLAPFQVEALERFSDRYSIKYQQKELDFQALFHNERPVFVEIGFGMGDAAYRIAQSKPEYNYLGIEVFLNGFAKLLHRVGSSEMPNLRLIRFDAVAVLESMIPDASVAGFHIFFPDPWPKKKHYKRRLIQAPFAQLLAKKLIEGGYVYCVTDWEPYAQQMLEVFETIPALENPYGGYAPPVSWRPTTSFERKGLEKNHPVLEVWVRRVSEH